MDIQFQGQNLKVDDVLKRLRPVVTEERLLRIQKVVKRRRNDLCLAMENIYNRGNTNAVMRSLEAFGYYQIHHIQLQNEYKESNRVTQGADKWLTQKTWPTTESCVHNLKSQGYKIYVTHLEGGKPMDQCDFRSPVALCMGNEQEGASPVLTELADEKVTIPMFGFVQSFNISVAAALCLQHIRREHEALGPRPLPEQEQEALEALYLLRSCRNPLTIMG